MKKIIALLALAVLGASPARASSGAQPAANAQSVAGATEQFAGSLAATGQTVAVAPAASYTLASVQLTGTWAGTVVFETADDVAQTFVPVTATAQNTGMQGASATANGIYLVPLGHGKMQVRCSAYTSGTIGVVITASSVALMPAVVVAGSDGTNLRALSTTAGGAVNVSGLPTAGITTSSLGSANAPAAGAAIATLAAPGAGNYSVSVTAFVGAGAAAAETNNMQLKIGGTVIATLPIPPSANGPAVMVAFPRLGVPAATAITVNAVGAATGTVFYTALIVATPVN